MRRDHTIDVLNDLIDTCTHGATGLQAGAERLHEHATRQLFRDRAAECRRAATGLQDVVRQRVRESGDEGAGDETPGDWRVGGVCPVPLSAGHDDLAILEASARRADAALTVYREALDEDFPPTLRALLARQYAGAQRSRDELRTLRDRARLLKPR